MLRLIKDSEARIDKMLSLSKSPYLALSFGKDSIVMWDLVRKQKPDIKCLFLTDTETFMMFEYEELIKHYKNNYSINLEVIRTDTLAENNYNLDKARDARRANWYLPQFINKDGVFMGLRIEESKARRMTLLKKENNQIGRFIMQYKTGKRAGQYRCCPVADWASADILTYCKMNNLKLLGIYEQGNHIRTTARIPRDEKRANALNWIRISNPQKYQLLKNMIPELQYL